MPKLHCSVCRCVSNHRHVEFFLFFTDRIVIFFEYIVISTSFKVLIRSLCHIRSPKKTEAFEVVSVPFYNFTLINFILCCFHKKNNIKFHSLHCSKSVYCNFTKSIIKVDKTFLRFYRL